MKKTLLVIVSAVIVAGAAYLATRQGQQTKDTPVTVIEDAVPTETQATEPRVSREAAKEKPLSVQQPVSAGESQPAPVKAKAPQPAVFEQALNTLVAPQASYQEKQAAWGQLRSAGKLDQVISELEQRIAASPSVPENHAAMGQACLQKAGTIQDVREQGILGMKADQSFDAALNIDPQNWDARFWKATAMSYWPPQLGKGKEVIENCLELMKQQEVRPPEPQFAQTYVLLGDEYKKQGHQEYATQVWNRGLGLFPSNEALTQRVSAQQ